MRRIDFLLKIVLESTLGLVKFFSGGDGMKLILLNMFKIIVWCIKVEINLLLLIGQLVVNTVQIMI